MKRNITIALLAIVVLSIASLILPASLAKRGKSELGNGGGKKSPSEPAKSAPTTANLFSSPQAPSGPISRQAVGFAVSPALRDIPQSSAADYNRELSIKFSAEELEHGSDSQDRS